MGGELEGAKKRKRPLSLGLEPRVRRLCLCLDNLGRRLWQLADRPSCARASRGSISLVSSAAMSERVSSGW